MNTSAELSGREIEIISLIANDLGLQISLEEKTSQAGLDKIIQKIGTMKWNPKDFHDRGISVSSFKKICAKLGGFRNFVPKNMAIFAELKQPETNGRTFVDCWFSPAI